APFKGCDLWLRKTELQMIMTAVESEIKNKTEEEQREEDELKEYSQKYNWTTENLHLWMADLREIWVEKKFLSAAFKRLPLTCRLAFLAACGKPKVLVFNPVTCNNSLSAEAVQSDQNQHE
ncbi:unnamed protein product, partial [Ixodes hexagonus]